MLAPNYKLQKLLSFEIDLNPMSNNCSIKGEEKKQVTHVTRVTVATKAIKLN